MALDKKIFHFTIGRFNCLAINDDERINCNCLLIDTGQHKVLLETGTGDGMTPPGALLKRLQAAGVSPALIDGVIVSHADFDHIGGAVDAHGNLAFRRRVSFCQRQNGLSGRRRPNGCNPTRSLMKRRVNWGITCQSSGCPICARK